MIGKELVAERPARETRRPFRSLARPVAHLVAAVLLVAAFHLAAARSDDYLIEYGRFFDVSAGEIAFKTNLLLLVLPAIWLAALACAELSPRAFRAFDALGTALRGRSWPLFVAALALGLAIAARVAVLRQAPITDDEQVYAFEARLLSDGRLYAESLPEAVRPFFDNQFIINNGRWYGAYFVGHPAVLALGSFIGVREWVGPLLAAATVLLGVGIARRCGGERVAVVAAVLTALSPFFVFMSATELSETTSACCMALFLYAAFRLEDEPRRVLWWLIAAAAVGYGVMTRPQTAIVFPLPVAARLAMLIAEDRLRPGWVGPVAATAVLTAGAAIGLGVNHALTGSPWRTSQMAYFDQGGKWVFDWGLMPTLDQIAASVGQLNFWLFGWPVSLVFLPFFRSDARACTLSAVVAAVVLCYGLFAIPMVMTVGPIYYAETIVPLAILSASGIEQLTLRLRARFGDTVRTRAVLLAPVVGLAASLVTFVPVESASLRRMAEVTRAPYDLVESQGLENALVFVNRLPSLSLRPGSFVWFHRNNAPDLSDPVLFVKDLGERNRTLMAYLPTRAPYRLGMHESALVLTPLAR